MSTARESRRDKLARRVALIRLVLTHPRNRDHPLRALGRIVGWQLWRHLVGRPVTARFGRRVRVRVYPDWPYSWTAIYLGLPEYDEMLFTVRFLQAGDVMVDVGANIGYYSLLGSSVNGGAPVIAFEPHPVASERLRENAALNAFPNIAVRPVAAGGRNTTARLTSELVDQNHIETNGSDDEPTVKVRVVTIDSELKRLDIDPAAVRLVKIDTEGFEASVIEGARGLLEQDPGPVWLVEVAGLGERYGTDDDALLRMFARHGYRAFRYSAETNRLGSLGLSEPAGRNVIFARRRSIISDRLKTAAGSRAGGDRRRLFSKRDAA